MQDSKYSVHVVVRSFEAGATRETFNSKKFRKSRVEPIRRLLRTASSSQLKKIIVVVCADPQSRYGEILFDGFTPTALALRDEFPDEVGGGFILPITCVDWGQNVGSVNALNLGINMALVEGATHVLSWSPRMGLDGSMITQMLDHSNRHCLELVGYFRERWYGSISTMFAQNTCALWSKHFLAATEGMNRECEGSEERNILVEGLGQVPLAGMEDFDAYLRYRFIRNLFPRWGMCGMHNPLKEELDHKIGMELQKHKIKLSRQEAVMREYIRLMFPYQDQEKILDEIMAQAYYA